MAYSEKEREQLFETIFELIENGKSLRKALATVKLSSSTFFIWIDENENKSKQYARACEERAEALLDEMLDIVDDTRNDYVEMDTGEDGASEHVLDAKPNYELIQRSRLRYDARKWLISKLNPKKYGEKVDVTSGGDKIQSAPTAINIGIVKPLED